MFAVWGFFFIRTTLHHFASKSEACQHAGQEPSAEAPPAVGEHVEDVAPAHERAWAPSRQDLNAFTTIVVMAMVKALRRPSMLAIPPMQIHVPFLDRIILHPYPLTDEI